MRRPSLTVALLASVVSAACSASCGHDASAPPTRRAPGDVDPRAADAPHVEETGPMLLLEAMEDQATTATYVAATFDPSDNASIRLGVPATHPSLQRTDAPTWYRTVRSQNAGRLARVERTENRYTLVVHTIADGAVVARVELGTMEPHALLLTETGVFLGSTTRVSYVDLESSTRSVETLVSRETPDRKAYDVFARAGDHVVAIDDVVRPIYADYFALRPHGLPEHLAGWEMPSLINGMYRHAVLVPTGADQSSLFVVAPYGIMDGNGQVLASLPIVGNTLGVGAEVLNSGARRPWVIEEHASRVRDGVSHFLSGDALTLFTGIAYAHDRILLPAGTRGLFVLPQALGLDAHADVVGDGAEIHDVTVVAGRVFVLATTGPDGHALIELAFTDGVFRFGTRTALPTKCVRFVD